METGSKEVAQTASTASEYFDLNYANEPASFYYLILSLERSRVKACWYHFAKNLITGYATYELGADHPEESLQKLLATKAFLKAEFKEVIVLLETPSFCLVPNLLKDYNAEELLSLTHQVNDSEQILSRNLVNLKARALFSAQPEVLDLIENTWSKQQILPFQIPLIEEALNQLKRKEKKHRVIAVIHEEHLSIMAFKNGQLVLTNSYFQSGKEDIAYYLLYAAEVLDIDPENVPLSLGGNIQKKDETWKLLANYWKSIRVLKELSHLKMGKKVQQAPSTNYAFLTHALLCAS